MIAQRQNHTDGGSPWAPSRLRVALATARHIASRGGHRLRLSGADREDLRQDILLAIVQRSHHYDPERGAWSTFTNVLARHVVADRARAQRLASGPEFVVTDLDDFAAGSSATQQDRTDPTLSLDLRRVANELPAEAETILRSSAPRAMSPRHGAPARNPAPASTAPSTTSGFG